MTSSVVKHRCPGDMTILMGEIHEGVSIRFQTVDQIQFSVNTVVQAHSKRSRYRRTILEQNSILGAGKPKGGQVQRCRLELNVSCNQ